MRDTRCILVDGSSFFYRAFHALPPLINSKGQATGAIYGVASMLKKLLNQYQPEYIAVIFDAPGKTFREDIYPEYKAHRPPTPPDLRSQYQPLVTLIEYLGIPVYAIPGVEADDVIGTLAKQAEAQGLPVTIATSDKDFAQMVNDHITLYNSMSEQWLDVAGVTQKYDVSPQQFRDYLSLIGDSSDNIPGVPKCGPKTASKWLQTYGSLEEIIAHAHDIPGKVGEYLRDTLAFFPISQKLVTIKSDLELNIKISDLKQGPTQTEALYQLAQDLEFKTWLKNLSQEKPNQKVDAKIRIIQSISDLDNYLQQLNPNQAWVVDTETNSLDPMQAEIIGLSLCSHLENACYIPLAHEQQDNCPKSLALEKLKPILENPDILKIGQNIKYDFHVLQNVGIHLKGINTDTMLESYVHNSTASRHDLGTLAQKYLHLNSISYEDVVGKGAKQLPFASVDIKKAAEYSGEDVLLTLKLHHFFSQNLSDTEQKLLHEIEIPVSIILGDMERCGVAIDCSLLQKLGVDLKARLETLQEQAFQIAGQTFNLQSPKQLAEILYTKLHLPILSKTPGGQPSTAEEVLQNLAQDYPLPAILIEHRRLSKLLSTYVEALPKRINPKTLRVHTSYNQAITSTGRLSSSDPNLQNIPVRTDEGRMIRKAFIAKSSYVLMTADYSQIELRLMAHFSKDALLLQAFNNNHDVHQATASEIFGIPMDQVTPEARRHAKTINFGLIYGMSAFGLAKQLNISRQEAQKYIEQYFHRYQGVHRYMEEARALAHQHGFVETLFGRRLYIPDIHSKNLGKVKAAERVAINAPLQGTAADLIKKAMIDIYDWLETHQEIRAKMIMQVHDELVFEIHQDDVEKFHPMLKHFMEKAMHLDVPLMVNIGHGQNWEEAH